MKQRLIDAEALKKAILDLNLDNSPYWLVVKAINDAPTVDPLFAYQCGYEAGLTEAKPIGEDILQQAWERGYKYGLLEQERPTGEWIFLKANEEQTDGYECSVCKATYHTKVPYFSEFNYCPNCGARMEVEEE